MVIYWNPSLISFQGRLLILKLVRGLVDQGRYTLEKMEEGRLRE